MSAHSFILLAIILLTERGLSEEGVWEEERECHSEATDKTRFRGHRPSEEKRPAHNAPQEQRPEMECGKILWPEKGQEKGSERRYVGLESPQGQRYAVLKSPGFPTFPTQIDL